MVIAPTHLSGSSLITTNTSVPLRLGGISP